MLLSLTAWCAAAVAATIATSPTNETPPWTHAKKHRYTVEWVGETPQRLEVQTASGQWKELDIGPGNSASTPLLAPGSVLRVNGQSLWPLTAMWTPIDFARWAGPGLRGAHVHDLMMATEYLWAATGHGGIARWDGQHWYTPDTPGLSQLLPIQELANIDDKLVLGGKGGVGFLSEDGSLELTPIPGQVLSLLTIEAELWINTTEGIYVLREGATHTVLKSPHCQGLFRGYEGAAWAQCDSLIELPVEAYIPGIEQQWTVHDVEILPSGAWLAVEGMGLVWWEPTRVEPLDQMGTIKHITRSVQDLFISSGDGLTHLSGHESRQYTEMDGLPSTQITELIPGPSEKVWVGTERGVALADPHGVATPLPLAAAPTDVPVYDIAPTDLGIAMATARGLVWLGMRAPKNWSSLAAAVGPAPRAVQWSAHGWWVANDRALFQLDRSGQLQRWPRYRDSEAIHCISANEEQLLIHQASGLRSWVVGATMLSPVEAHELELVRLSVDGSLWMLNEDRVIQQFQGHAQEFDISGVTDIAPDFGAAWAATDQGLRRLGIDGSVSPVTNEPLLKVATNGEAVWMVRPEGQLCGPSLTEPTCYDLGQGDPRFEVHALVADKNGVWVGTSRGAFRLLSSIQSK